MLEQSQGVLLMCVGGALGGLKAGALRCDYHQMGSTKQKIYEFQTRSHLVRIGVGRRRQEFPISLSQTGTRVWKDSLP